jgi:GAF domain-containing protein
MPLMHEALPDPALGARLPKPERYDELRKRVAALLEDEDDWLAALANVSAAVYEWLPGLNWAGFYLRKGGGLVLGPFQGRPACVRIAIGSGVCGTAVAEDATQVVADVHAFPGHIACDPRSRSEIVVPIRDAAGTVVAVLDLDSDRPATFDDEDRAGLEALIADVAPRVDWARACAG